MFPLGLIFSHCVFSLFLWTKVERDKTEGLWQMCGVCIHSGCCFSLLTFLFPGYTAACLIMEASVTCTASLRAIWVNRASTHTHIHTDTTSHHDIPTSQTRWQEIYSYVTSLFSFMKANKHYTTAVFLFALWRWCIPGCITEGSQSADVINVNRRILNHTLWKEREREKDKSEPDLLVKNDFSAHLFTEELSFAVVKPRARRERKWGRLLLETQWLERLMRGKKRQTEREHEGTKEGQTEEAGWLRSKVYCSTKYRRRSIYCLLPSSTFFPPGGFFTSFCLSW